MSNHRCICFYHLLFLLPLLAESFTTDSPSSIRLVKYLMDDNRYDPNVRPVKDHETPINIQIRMNLYQILEVNEPQQNVVLYVWMTQSWDDEFLGWDPAEYTNLKTIILPYNKIWLPDTYLYNRSEYERGLRTTTDRNKRQRDFPVARVTFQYPAIYKFSCKMYILYFPFDMQNCTLTFGSWTYDSTGIDFEPFAEKVMNESFVANEEWRVVSFNMQRFSVKYTCCEHPYVLLKMYLIIHRKPLYYVVNLVVPTAIITLIAVIGFFMPATTNGERAEKVNLGITTLLAMSILLLMVSDQMPTTSDFVPLMGWFFLTIIVLSSVGTAVTSFIILIQQQGHYGRKVPAWVRTLFFKCIAPMFCMSLPEDLKNYYEKGSTDSLYKGHQTDQRQPLVPDEFLMEPLVQKSVRGSRGENLHGFEDLHNNGAPSHTEAVFARHLQAIRKELGEIQGQLSGKEENDILLLEWEFLCAILDRVLLIFFITGILIVTACFLLIGSTADQSATLAQTF